MHKRSLSKGSYRSLKKKGQDMPAEDHSVKVEKAADLVREAERMVENALSELEGIGDREVELARRRLRAAGEELRGVVDSLEQ